MRYLPLHLTPSAEVLRQGTVNSSPDSLLTARASHQERIEWQTLQPKGMVWVLGLFSSCSQAYLATESKETSFLELYRKRMVVWIPMLEE